MNDSAHVAIVIGGVMFLAWCGLGRMARRDRLAVLQPPAEDLLELGSAALAAEFRPHALHTPGGVVACVECGTPYPAGILFCDCGAETEEDDEEALTEPDSTATSAELVCIHQTDNLWKANLLRSFLESHLIPCTVQRGAQGTALEIVPLHRLGSYSLFVQADDATVAKTLLSHVESNQRS